MTDGGFRRVGAWGAFALAASSILYAIAYLAIMPSDQRGDDVGAFFRSYAEDPTGRRLPSVFFVTAGLAGALAVAALAERLRGVSLAWARWLGTAGVVANLAGMAHGVWSLSRVEEPSDLYRTAANQAAVEVVYRQPSGADPLGVFRFGVGGLLALLLGLLILRAADLPRGLGWLGVALGIAMIALFFADWAGAGGLVLLFGGPASLILLPAFWMWAGVRLLRDAAGVGGPASRAADAPVGAR